MATPFNVFHIKRLYLKVNVPLSIGKGSWTPIVCEIHHQGTKLACRKITICLASCKKTYSAITQYQYHIRHYFWYEQNALIS